MVRSTAGVTPFFSQMTRDLESDLKGKLEKISEKEELLAAEVEENEELLRRVEGMRDQRRKIKNEITEMDLAIGHLKGDVSFRRYWK